MTTLTILTSPGRYRPASFERLARDAEVRWTEADGLAAALPGSDALLMWDFFSPALADALPAADALRWVHAASAGVDSLRFPALVEHGAEVTNAHGVFDQAIAEYVLHTVLMFAKRAPESLELQRVHDWRRRELEQVAGTRALVVGTGGIGRRIAQLLNGLGVEVAGAASRERAGDADFTRIVDSAQLAAHLAEVDWLINAAPLTEATTGLFDAEVFAALPARARFISIGRGRSTVTDDLVRALETGQIAGAGLDVTDPEPLPAGHPLWDAPGALITAHLSGDTEGWMDRLAAQFLEYWDRWIAGAPFPQTVDLRAGYVPSRS
ncbi:D-2-hydroxyacid dehydrogenase [Brevibacterium album]|uniref:D-2-hydroxyacid dehydrogenase n=1 Tax=Brevibacterium album TaxID=417948 RepID=UPI0004222D3C|nr:D-2-hydroxyacid dehydrogenase [Brevibacterium album]